MFEVYKGDFGKACEIFRVVGKVRISPVVLSLFLFLFLFANLFIA